MSDAGNQYDIIQKIGEGGMGTVYLANDRMLDRRVAIKQLNRSSTVSDEGMSDRFQQEALALARLNHPNITHLYAFIPREDTYWMVMEFVEGKTLEEWLRIHKKITHILAASIAVQMLDGLQHAHKRGIIHRDIKPANVMIHEDGEVKIMDFGIARMRNAQRITRHGKSVGTLEYMAPEQIQGKEGDERTDVYAVGNILYEMLCGMPPFQGDTDFQLMKDKLEKQPAPIINYNPTVPLPLQQVIFKALDRNPERRYQSASELKQAIERSLEGSLLVHAELTEVLKASQVFTRPQAGNEVISVSALLARAQKVSGKIRVPRVKKMHRPFLFLGASVMICALLIWSSASDDTAGKDKNAQETTSAGPYIPAAPLDETSVAGGNSFGETPNEMYRRISEPSDEATRTGRDGDERKSASKKTSATETTKPVSDGDPDQVAEAGEPEAPSAARQPADVPAGKLISVALAEDISSEQKDRDGSPVRLVCNEDVTAGDRVIIRKGAPVTGKIVDVIPSSSQRKKALIGFVIQQVTAVDGSVVKLHSDRFRLFADAPGIAVSYKKGQSFQAALKKGRVR